MTLGADEVEALLCSAQRGDEYSIGRLFDHGRECLRRMVAVRLDTRVASRIDPSDVIQDALADAARKFDAYLRDRPLPFYLWLRALALERVLNAHRVHIHAGVRSVIRERADEPMIYHGAASLLADRLIASDSSPSRRLTREEDLCRVRCALDRLKPSDREILQLRYLEQLAFKEVAAVLSISEDAAKLRHFRALERIRDEMGGDFRA